MPHIDHVPVELQEHNEAAPAGGRYRDWFAQRHFGEHTNFKFDLF